MPHRRRAFTMIELLMVIIIMLILASMVIATIAIARQAVERTATRAAVVGAQAALKQVAVSSGVSASPATHPLGADAAHALLAADDDIEESDRARYYRDGSLLNLTDEALGGEAEWFRPSHRVACEARLLHPDDLFAGYLADGDVPALFGLPRAALGILAPRAEWITQVRKLPDPERSWEFREPTLLPDSYLKVDDSDEYSWKVYPDDPWAQTKPLAAGLDYESATERHLAARLGDHLSQLSEDGSIGTSPAADTTSWISCSYEARDPADPTQFVSRSRDVDVAAPVSGDYDPHHRVWLAPEEYEHWGPGEGIDGANYLWIDADGDGQEEWRSYQPRGSYLQDGWGRELLFMIGPNDTYHLLSAGADGCFAVDPGANGIVDTDIAGYVPGDASTLGGDDQNGAYDNIGENAVFHDR